MDIEFVDYVEASGSARKRRNRTYGVAYEGDATGLASGYALKPRARATGVASGVTVLSGNAVMPRRFARGAVGIGGVAVAPRRLAFGSASLPGTDFIIGTATKPLAFATGAATGRTILHGTAVKPRNTALGSPYAIFGVAIKPRATTGGFAPPDYDAYLSAVEWPHYAYMTGSVMVPTIAVAVSDGLLLDADPFGQEVQRIVEALELSGAFDTLLSQMVRVADGLTLTDVVRAILAVHLTDTVALGAQVTATPVLAVQVIDALALASGTTSVQTMVALVSVTLALIDAGYTVEQALAQSGMTLGDALEAQARAYARVIEDLRLAATPIGTLRLVALVRDGLVLDDAAAAAAEILAVIRDGLSLLAQVHLDNDPFIAWVMNTEGDRPVFTYDNWPFNSYGQLGDQYLAAGPDGIYILGGPDNDGDPILWSIRSGLMDFGTTRKKRMEQLYLAYSTDGRLGLRIIVTQPTGEKRAYDYEMRPRPALATSANRIKVGRGHASREWAFELHSLDGATTTLADMQLLPMILDRSIN